MRLLKTIGFLSMLLMCPFTNADTEKNIESVYMSGTKGDYLAGAHSKLGLGCDSCHSDNFTIDDNNSLENGNCIECHGTYQALKQEDQNKGIAISAHNGHLVDPSCTSCHAGHVESFVYCNNCHVFPMKISYGTKEKPIYKPEDFSKYEAIKPNRVEQTDIVIVGGGGAGMVAAIEAADAGKKVILLEKMPIIGGSSLLSSGGINAANTKIQRAHGIEDSVDMFVKDTLAIGSGTNDEKLVRIMAEGSSDAIDWVTGLGAELTINPKEVYAKTSVARMHFTQTGGIGKYLIGFINDKLKASNADVRLNSQVVGLNKDSNGRVTGVLVQGKNTGIYEIQAGATILTTGSYANNPEIITKYHPNLKGIVYSTQPGSTGDGVVIAQHIGAKEINMEKVQIHPNIANGTSLMITLAMRLSGGILVNSDGVRFIDDNAPRNDLGPAILEQQGQHAYLIYDDAVVNKRKLTHEGYVRLGLVTEANTPAELAEKLNLPKDKFVQTMQTYAKAYESQKDSEFNRKQLPEPLTNGKLYAIDVIPAVGGTLGGISVDTDMRVLDVNNKPIQSLFAAGEVVGGWHGDDRYGGNAVVGNIVFGKRVAQSAIKSLP